MKIKIWKDAHLRYIRSHNNRLSSWVNWTWSDVLECLEDEILTVETKHLFNDQFNTEGLDIYYLAPKMAKHKSKESKAKLASGALSGWRIMAESVEYVIEDMRIIMMRCQWCGKSSKQAAVCPKCDKSDYLSWFHTITAGAAALYALEPGQSAPRLDNDYVTDSCDTWVSNVEDLYLLKRDLLLSLGRHVRVTDVKVFFESNMGELSPDGHKINDVNSTQLAAEWEVTRQEWIAYEVDKNDN